MEPIIGQIILFAGSFAPKGWAFCDGSLLPIGSNTALFSLLGTTYGGNGQTTFALPDLRGRVPMGAGAGPGLTQRSPGELLGTETVTLTADQIASHSHMLTAYAAEQSTDSASGNLLAGASIYSTQTAPVVSLAPTTIGASGGNQPHENMQPTLCINYIIATEGIYPPRP